MKLCVVVYAHFMSAPVSDWLTRCCGLIADCNRDERKTAAGPIGGEKNTFSPSVKGRNEAECCLLTIPRYTPL